ncbi:MAG: hydroxyisourate hydrolase [Opitutales bacterium]
MKNALTTHVLDTYHGRPAQGVAISLERADGTALGSFTTDDNGRTPPLLEGANLVPGKYALTFAVADYFKAQGVALTDPPFLDRVTLAFGVAKPEDGYHVPLVMSPWTYSTYRGS